MTSMLVIDDELCVALRPGAPLEIRELRERSAWREGGHDDEDEQKGGRSSGYLSPAPPGPADCVCGSTPNSRQENGVPCGEPYHGTTTGGRSEFSFTCAGTDLSRRV